MGTLQVDGGIGSLRLVGPWAEYLVFKNMYMGEGQGRKPLGVGMDIHFPTTSSIREWGLVFYEELGSGKGKPAPSVILSLF